MRSRLLAAITAGAALTACGSTVQVQGQASVGVDQGLDGSGQAAGLDTATPAGETAGASSGATGSPSPAGAVGPTASASTGPAASAGTLGTGTSSGSGATATGTSKTAGVVQVGIMLYPDVSKAAAAFGAKSGNTDNQRQVADAMVAWVNAHGGLAGRRVQLVVHNVSLTSADTYAQLQQQACTDFGEDHHVTAVLTVASSIDNTFPQCLAKYGILDVAGGHYLHDDTDFRNVRNLVAPSEASTAAVGRALVDEMVSRGFLKSGDKLGMLTEDAPAGVRTTDNVITPLLKAKGIQVINYVIHGPSSTADISNAAAAIQSAELRMAGAGVKNVAFMCKGCLSLFMGYAESQRYHPRYFLHSIDGIRGLNGAGHGESLKNAIALSWEQLLDQGGYSHPKELTGNASRDLCHTLTRKLVTDDTSEFIAQSICGGFLDLHAAAGALKGAPVTGANLMAGFDTFGAAHPSAVSFRTEITKAKHYGAVGYRRMHYTGPCDCFEYDSKVLHPFPR